MRAPAGAKLGRMWRIALLLFLLPLGYGCLLTAGAVGVATAGEDSVETVLDRELEDAYRDALDVIESRGESRERTPEFYRFTGRVDGADVRVELSPVTSRRTLLRVSARKLEGAFPDRALARDLAGRIVLLGRDSARPTAAEGAGEIEGDADASSTPPLTPSTP